MCEATPCFVEPDLGDAGAAEPDGTSVSVVYACRYDASAKRRAAPSALFDKGHSPLGRPHWASHAARAVQTVRVISRLAGLVALMVAVSACGGGGSAQPQISLKACTISSNVQAVCGSLRVYEDRAAASGRQISLRIAVLKAQSDQRKPDPVFYLAGFGSGAVDLASLATTEMREVNRDRDIVLVDQRGTGGSNPLVCATPSPEEQLAIAADDVAFGTFVNDCLTNLAGDPRLYTTPIATDDLDQARVALGYDKINLYGVSYGVSFGLAYLQRHGSHVRSAIFDSGSMLDYRLWEWSAPHAQQALDQLFDRCLNDTTCNETFPSLKARFTAVQTRLANAAATLTFTDPRSGAGDATITVAFNSKMFAWVVENLDAYTNTAVLLPRLIDQAYKGDMVPIARQYFVMGAQPLSTVVQTWVVACSDEWAQMDPTRVAQIGQGSYFLDVSLETARTQAKMCGLLPTLVGSAGKVATDAPVLFLNGTADPADPPENVASAKTTMPNSLSLAIEGAGHGIIDLGCVPTMAAAFYSLGSTRSLPLACAKSVTLPRFDLGTP